MDNIDQLFLSDDVISDEFLLRQYVTTIGVYSQVVKIGDVRCQVHNERIRDSRGLQLDSQPCNSTIFIVSLVDYCLDQLSTERGPIVSRVYATFGGLQD